MEENNNKLDINNFKKDIEKSEGYLKWQSVQKQDRKFTVLLTLILLALGYYLLSTNSYQFTVWPLICFGISALLIFYNITRKINLDTYNKIQIESKLLENKKVELQRQTEKKKLNDTKKQKNKEEKAKLSEASSYQERIDKRLAPLKLATLQVKEIKKIKVDKINDFKTFVIDNESKIIDIGGEDKLFQFLKVDEFLQDFRNRILIDVQDIINVYNEKEIERAIIQDENFNKSSLEYIVSSLDNSVNVLDGKTDMSFKAKTDRLFKISSLLKPTIYNQINTMLFYNSLAFAMTVALLDNNKIRYFEIYSAFDKLGVFDSSWQKNVATKLGSIDLRLANLNNQMTELNQNFIRLAESSEHIALELEKGFKSVNSRLETNNLLSAITTYQVYKINKNTKRL